MHLQLYNKPYLQILTTPEVLTYVNNQLACLNLEQHKKSYALERAVISGYYASVFDSKNQYMEKKAKDFVYNNSFDYVYGPHKIKLISGRPNEYDKSSGYSQEFSIPRFLIKEDSNTILIYCVYRFPFVDFVGWSSSDTSNFTTQKNSLRIFAGSEKIKSFKEHPYLSKKVTIPYVSDK